MGKRVLYRKLLRKALKGIDQAAVDQVVRIMGKAKRVLVIGNGGSMATAVHFAGDLTKNAGVPAMACDNLTALTAWANDDGYENVFKEWLFELHQEGDVLVAISTSGNSENVIKAVAFATAHKIPSIVLTAGSGGAFSRDFQFDKGLNGRPYGATIIVPTDVIEVAEDCHSAICHEIVWSLK